MLCKWPFPSTINRNRSIPWTLLPGPKTAGISKGPNLGVRKLKLVTSSGPPELWMENVQKNDQELPRFSASIFPFWSVKHRWVGLFHLRVDPSIPNQLSKIWVSRLSLNLPRSILEKSHGSTQRITIPKKDRKEDGQCAFGKLLISLLCNHNTWRNPPNVKGSFCLVLGFFCFLQHFLFRKKITHTSLSLTFRWCFIIRAWCSLGFGIPFKKKTPNPPLNAFNSSSFKLYSEVSRISTSPGDPLLPSQPFFTPVLNKNMPI